MNLVDGLVNQQDVTSQASRRGNGLFEIEQNIGVHSRLIVIQIRLPCQLVLKLYNAEGPVLSRSHLPNVTLDRTAAVSGDVVPDNFQAVLRDREWRSGLVITQAVTTLDQLHTRGVVNSILHDLFRVCSGTVRLVYRHDVIVITLDHCDLSRGQVFRILVNVALVDGELWLFVRERVHIDTIVFIPGRRRRQTAIPGRNCAPVTRFLSTHWRERVTELGRFLCGNRAKGVTRNQRCGQNASGQ